MRTDWNSPCHTGWSDRERADAALALSDSRQTGTVMAAMASASVSHGYPVDMVVVASPSSIGLVQAAVYLGAATEVNLSTAVVDS